MALPGQVSVSVPAGRPPVGAGDAPSGVLGSAECGGGKKAAKKQPSQRRHFKHMRSTMLITRKFIALSAMLMIVASAPRAEATEKQRKELAVVANSLAKAMNGMAETSVAMGAFKGTSTPPTSSGPLFTKLL